MHYHPLKKNLFVILLVAFCGSTLLDATKGSHKRKQRKQRNNHILEYVKEKWPLPNNGLFSQKTFTELKKKRKNKKIFFPSHLAQVLYHKKKIDRSWFSSEECEKALNAGCYCFEPRLYNFYKDVIGCDTLALETHRQRCPLFKLIELCFDSHYSVAYVQKESDSIWQEILHPSKDPQCNCCIGHRGRPGLIATSTTNTWISSRLINDPELTDILINVPRMIALMQNPECYLQTLIRTKVAQKKTANIRSQKQKKLNKQLKKKNKKKKKTQSAKNKSKIIIENYEYALLEPFHTMILHELYKNYNAKDIKKDGVVQITIPADKYPNFDLYIRLHSFMTQLNRALQDFKKITKSNKRFATIIALIGRTEKVDQDLAFAKKLGIYYSFFALKIQELLDKNNSEQKYVFKHSCLFDILTEFLFLYHMPNNTNTTIKMYTTLYFYALSSAISVLSNVYDPNKDEELHPDIQALNTSLNDKAWWHTKQFQVEDIITFANFREDAKKQDFKNRARQTIAFFVRKIKEYALDKKLNYPTGWDDKKFLSIAAIDHASLGKFQENLIKSCKEKEEKVKALLALEIIKANLKNCHIEVVDEGVNIYPTN